jgi:hypothetical protein
METIHLLALLELGDPTRTAHRASVPSERLDSIFAEALPHCPPRSSLGLPTPELLGVRFDRLPSRLRLGLPPSLPVGAGCLHVAVGAPGGEPVAAASIPAKFLRTLHLAAVPAFLHPIVLLSLFFTFSRGKRARGVRERPLKNDPSILASLHVRVPMTPSTQRREVRALIRSSILRSDDVVTDEALGLTALRATMAVSLLHPSCRLLPPSLVQRRTR